jgi:D-arabinose 1-dehydrogenase-like Zn-dependent alcohol dehydrogenase
MNAQMRVARLHAPGEPLRIDRMPVPELGPRDVLVEVKACGVIPNMNAIFGGTLWNRLPPLPASVGLDAAGIVVQAGSAVGGIAIGARVYVNPWLSCGTCAYCRAGAPLQCNAAAFQGYFGFTDRSESLLRAYPYGGFAEYMPAAADRLVMLPRSVSFEQAARFGYLGTSFAALRRGGVSVGSWIAINGITGTLGVGATLHALAMGATRILGIGRNREVLSQLTALAPARVATLALGDEPVAQWLLERTDRIGVDVLLDCSGRAASASTTTAALGALKPGGVAVNIGALTEKLEIEPISFMVKALTFRGSNWFTTGEGQLMADAAGVGALDLSVLQTRAYPLENVNDALAEVKKRPGGLVNIVVNPDR